MLSSDILTEFRGRGDEIRVNPLSFEEFYHAYEGDKRDAWQEYYTYGGLPLVMMKKSHEEKAKYLQSLFDKIYLGDIIERNKILHDKSVLDDILNIISSSVGSLTNAGKIAKTFRSERQVNISDETVSRYLEFFVDAFMIYKADRYDVKGRKYIGSPLKYYFSDVGLRNARLNFPSRKKIISWKTSSIMNFCVVSSMWMWAWWSTATRMSRKRASAHSWRSTLWQTRGAAGIISNLP